MRKNHLNIVTTNKYVHKMWSHVLLKTCNLSITRTKKQLHKIRSLFGYIFTNFATAQNDEFTYGVWLLHNGKKIHTLSRVTVIRCHQILQNCFRILIDFLIGIQNWILANLDVVEAWNTTPHNLMGFLSCSHSDNINFSCLIWLSSPDLQPNLQSVCFSWHPCFMLLCTYKSSLHGHFDSVHKMVLHIHGHSILFFVSFFGELWMMVGSSYPS